MSNRQRLMLQLWIHIVGIAIVLLFSLYSSLRFVISKSAGIFLKLVATIAFAFTVILIIKRDTYLPFLGYAAFPISLMPQEDVAPINATKEIDLTFDETVKDGTYVIYWGAQPSDDAAVSPSMAYGDYRNTGVTSVRGGKAKVKFACPGEYYVPFGRKMNRHIHYRLCCARNGMLGPVQTAFVRC